MDVDRLLRLKGTVQASVAAPDTTGGQGLVASYGRIRSEVVAALGTQYEDGLSRLFPGELATSGRPWGQQELEVKTLLTQLAGWIDGVIEGQILNQRIQAEAEAKARTTGFR
jgi:hypothetical protein